MMSIPTNKPISAVTYNGTNIPLASSEVELQAKTATPTESAQTITADDGYDGLSEVDISAIPSNYVGSSVSRRTSSDLTASGATVTVPQGYYASQASKSVANGSVTVNTPTINTSTGVVTASATVNAGYVSGNPQSKTLNLTTQGSTTITPTKQQQTAVASGRYTTGAVYVGAIPSEYIIPTGSKEITANADNIDVAQYSTVNVNVPSSGGNYQTKTLTLGSESPPSEILPDSGGGGGIVPKTETWTHNQWVDLSVDIDAQGNLTIRQSGGGGTTTGLKICYPQGSSTQITKIPNIPTVAGNYELPITASWSGDSNDHTLTYTVSSGGTSYDALEKVNVSIDTSVIKAENIAQGVTILGVQGTHSGGSGKAVQISNASNRRNGTSYAQITGVSLTVEKTGTYDVYWSAFRSSTSGTFGTQLYIGTTGQTQQTTFSNHEQHPHMSNVSLTAGQTLSLYGRSGASSNYIYVSNLTIIEA